MKSLQLKDSTWKDLSLLKLDFEVKTYDDIIVELIKQMENTTNGS